MSEYQHDSDRDEFFKKFAAFYNENDDYTSVQFFNTFSSQYDLYMSDVNSDIHKELVNFLSEQIELSDSLNKNCSILDVCCGTGMVGRLLREGGFTGNLEGVDGAQEMIDRAEKLENVYDKLYTEELKPDAGSTSLPKQNYDVVIAGHAFFPKYLEAEHLEMLFTLLKVGGLLLFNLKYDNTGAADDRIKSYVAGIGEKINELVKQEKCQRVGFRDVDGVSRPLKYIDLIKNEFVHEEQYCLKK